MSGDKKGGWGCCCSQTWEGADGSPTAVPRGLRGRLVVEQAAGALSRRGLSLTLPKPATEDKTSGGKGAPSAKQLAADADQEDAIIQRSLEEAGVRNSRLWKNAHARRSPKFAAVDRHSVVVSCAGEFRFRLMTRGRR